MLISPKDKKICNSLPTYDTKQEAVQAALQIMRQAEQNKTNDIYEVWREPENRGGRYAVVESAGFEAVYRGEYQQIMNAMMLYDIMRGEHVEEIEETAGGENVKKQWRMAPEEGPHGVDRWTSNGYGLIIDGKPVEPISEAEKSQMDEVEEISEQ